MCSKWDILECKIDLLVETFFLNDLKHTWCWSMFVFQELEEAFRKDLEDVQHIKDNIPAHMPMKKVPVKWGHLYILYLLDVFFSTEHCFVVGIKLKTAIF